MHFASADNRNEEKFNNKLGVLFYLNDSQFSQDLAHVNIAFIEAFTQPVKLVVHKQQSNNNSMVFIVYAHFRPIFIAVQTLEIEFKLYLGL